MRRFLPLTVLALAIIGCSDNSTQAVTTTTTTVAPVVGPPTLASGGKLGLFADPEKPDSGQLSVGDPPSMVDKLFPSGGAYINRQLPKGFNDYTGMYFDLNGAAFGVIYYKNPAMGPDTPSAVAMAMKFEVKLNQQDVDSTVQAYQTALGKPTNAISGPITGYDFWEDAVRNQRVMICYVQSQSDKSKLNMTVSVGDFVVMNKLRMDYIDAKKDSAAVQPLQPLAQG